MLNNNLLIRNGDLIFVMRKRERENPCGVCGHYHKYEEGEVCGICGHRLPENDKAQQHQSAFPTEILPEFLFLSSYDNASRAELLKTQGISRVLNTVPACQNLYKNSFTYHCLQEEQRLPFDDANQFLKQCAADKARVLVHCMSGKNRSPAIVMAYLMKSKGWRLAQSYQWVKERRPVVELSEAINQQLQEYEQRLYGSINNFSSSVPSFSFGVTEPSNPSPVHPFSTSGTSSIFAHPISDVPQAFTFGAGQAQPNAPEDPLSTAPNITGNDITMAGS